jgi:ATP-dependent Lon protease
LNGHNYTYEGSTPGKIVDLLTQTGCMNPIIFFDELDKVSETTKGEEIINILMHLTDSTQNSHFSDRYFTGLDFDLSKAILIFSFNDAQKVSRILKDRMKIIKVDGYKIDDKIEIARRHLIPKLFKSIGLTNVEFSDEIIQHNENVEQLGVDKIGKNGKLKIILDVELSTGKTRIKEKESMFPLGVKKEMHYDQFQPNMTQVYIVSSSGGILQVADGATLGQSFTSVP